MSDWILPKKLNGDFYVTLRGEFVLPHRSASFALSVPTPCIMRGVWASPARLDIFEFTEFRVDGAPIDPPPVQSATETLTMSVPVAGLITGIIRNKTEPGSTDAITLAPSLVFGFSHEVS